MTYASLLFTAFSVFSLLSAPNTWAATIAYVNETPITSEDVEKEMAAVPDMLIAGRQDEIQKAIVERLIQKRLIMEEAEKRKITEDKAFQAQLATLRENLIFNFVMTQKLDESITPIKLRTYYKQNKHKFTQPAIRVGHILLETKEEAHQVLKQLEKGEDFAELAKSLSNGPSATRGGELGWIKEGEMVPTFEEAAFALGAGKISPKPLKTQFGWHIIKVFEKNDAYTPPFPDVEEMIQRKMSEELVKTYLKELEQEAKIRYETK